MATLLTCACGASFNLKDEHAGGKFACPKCGGPLTAAGAAAPAGFPGGHHPAFHRHKYLLRQKLLSISEKYSLSDEQGNGVIWIERPARILRQVGAIAAGLAVGATLIGLGMMLGSWGVVAGAVLALPGTLGTMIMLGPKRHVTFYADEAMTDPLLKVYQDQRFVLLTATYSVALPDGTQLAKLEKNHIHNLLRKKWAVYRPDGSVWAVAREDSILLALLRRFLGTFYGLLRTNFIICHGESEDVIGEFNRKMTIRDHYVLDLSADGTLRLDRRVATALCVLLDTGESR